MAAGQDIRDYTIDLICLEYFSFSVRSLKVPKDQDILQAILNEVNWSLKWYNFIDNQRHVKMSNFSLNILYDDGLVTSKSWGIFVSPEKSIRTIFFQHTLAISGQDG